MPLYCSNTGSTALRDAEVQQPITAAHLSLHQKLLRLLGEGRPVAGAVFLDELDLAAEHAALRVDLLDGELLGLDRTGLADRHRAGDGMQDADRDFGVGDREAGRVDLRGRRRVGARQLRQHRRGRQRRPRRRAARGGSGVRRFPVIAFPKTCDASIQQWLLAIGASGPRSLNRRLRRIIAVQHTSIDVYAYVKCRIIMRN